PNSTAMRQRYEIACQWPHFLWSKGAYQIIGDFLEIRPKMRFVKSLQLLIFLFCNSLNESCPDRRYGIGQSFSWCDAEQKDCVLFFVTG
ncbi:MAG: hypothetical protein AB2653_00280, partial [Candidatus Thiodiazotropha endolucinida]